MSTLASGTPCPTQEILMSRRSDAVNDAIRDLLRHGTVQDLRSEKGRLLESQFTPNEAAAAVYLPMPVCRGFDGQTCDDCRGLSRFADCPECHGFDPKGPA